MNHWCLIVLFLAAQTGLATPVGVGQPQASAALESEPALITAVRAHDLEQVRALIADGKGLLDVSPVTHWSALHWSVRLEVSTITEELVSIPGILQLKDAHGKTALHIAAAGGQAEEARLLLNRGLEIDCRDNLGATPLHLAVLNGEYEMAEWLIQQGADVNARTQSGVSPFSFARLLDSESLEELLLSAGAQPEERQLKPIPELPRLDPRAFTPKPAADSNTVPSPTTSSPTGKSGSGNTPAGPDAGMQPDPPRPDNEHRQPPPSADPKIRETIIQQPFSVLGFEPAAVPAAELRSLRLPGAVKVSELRPDSAAALSGLRDGDLILRVGDNAVSDPQSLQRHLATQIERGQATGKLLVTRRSERISLQINLPLPLFQRTWSSQTRAWTLAIPDGWFLLFGRRNKVADSEFDTLLAPDGSQLLIVSREGFALSQLGNELGDYREQKIREASGNLDVHCDDLTIAGLSAFRLAYRLAENASTSVSRIAFDLQGRRFVINTVRYDSHSTELSDEMKLALLSIQIQKTP